MGSVNGTFLKDQRLSQVSENTVTAVLFRLIGAVHLLFMIDYYQVFDYVSVYLFSMEDKGMRYMSLHPSPLPPSSPK